MKRFMVICGTAMCVWGCGGDAHDGDAHTDTTSLPADRGVYGSDTALNTNTGTYGTGTNAKDSFSSKGTDPASRKTTPGNDSVQ